MDQSFAICLSLKTKESAVVTTSSSLYYYQQDIIYYTSIHHLFQKLKQSMKPQEAYNKTEEEFRNNKSSMQQHQQQQIPIDKNVLFSSLSTIKNKNMKKIMNINNNSSPNSTTNSSTKTKLDDKYFNHNNVKSLSSTSNTCSLSSVLNEIIPTVQVRSKQNDVNHDTRQQYDASDDTALPSICKDLKPDIYDDNSSINSTSTKKKNQQHTLFRGITNNINKFNGLLSRKNTLTKEEEPVRKQGQQQQQPQYNGGSNKQRSCMKGSRKSSNSNKKRSVRFGANSKLLSVLTNHKDYHVSEVHIIKPLFQYNLWWSKDEIKHYQNQETPFIDDEDDVDKEDDDDNNKEMFSNDHSENQTSLAVYICSYQVLRHQMHTFFEQQKQVMKDDDCNNDKIILFDMKILQNHFIHLDYEHFVDGIRHDGYVGLERFMGSDSKKRHHHTKSYVKKIVSYYQLMVPKQQKNKGGKTIKPVLKSNKNNNNTDFVYRMVRTQSELNTYQDRYWARFIGHAVHESEK